MVLQSAATMWENARTAENLSKAQSVAMSIRQAMTGKGFSKKIGYYAPYGIRKIEPERDFYGKDMTLTSEQAKDLAEFVRVYRPYQWVSIGWLVDRATENGDFVVINADW